MKKKSKDISPKYETYIITDNKTLSDGNVVNAHDENAELARKWVDDNEK